MSPGYQGPADETPLSPLAPFFLLLETEYESL